MGSDGGSRMKKCGDVVTYSYEEMWYCEREEGHDGPHRSTEETPERTLTFEWTHK